MIKNYKPSHWVTGKYYKLKFYTDASGGCAFDCDENGNITNAFQRKFYEYCMAHPEKYTYAFNEIEEIEYDYKEPATGTCNCGEEIELYNEYMGACECPKCGQWWNLFGQELNPVETWASGDDW